MSKTPSAEPKSLGGDVVKPKGGPKLKAEVRAYTVTEADLSEWLTAQTATKFYVVKIETQGNGDIEFTVSTEKQAVPPSVGTLNERRAAHGLPPLEEAEVTDPADITGEPVADPATGPAVIDDGQPVGQADPVPMIAPRRHEGVKVERFKTGRELRLEAQKRQRDKGPNITHIEDGSDDPVPSALPR